MTRRLSSDCSSDLQLDRLSTGELAAPEARVIEAHLATCNACATRREALAREQRALAQQLLPFEAIEAAARPLEAEATGAAALPRALRRGGAQQRWLAAGSLAAAVAIGVALSLPQSPGSEPSGNVAAESVTRTKGGAGVRLDWVVRRGGQVFAADPRATLQPGDALRFEVSSSRAGVAAVLSLDGAGQASVYHGWAPVAAAERQLLPGAVELDAVLGEEHLYLVICERAEPLAKLEQAILRAPTRPELPPGCKADQHRLRKERP